jgi:hypothetical protein
MAQGHSLTTHQMLYIYIISKTNEISFSTHPLVVAYYEHMYHITLWFLFSSPCQAWWWPYKKGRNMLSVFDSLYLNKVLLCFDLPTLSIEILCSGFLHDNECLVFKTQWISWSAERLSASEGENCRIQLDGWLIIILKKYIFFSSVIWFLKYQSKF